jgi:3-oxoacyl-[acyl-carrier protein] reductase
LKQAAKEIGALPIFADVSNPGNVIRTYDEFLGRFGGLDCLINNAGIGIFKPMEEVQLFMVFTAAG